MLDRRGQGSVPGGIQSGKVYEDAVDSGSSATSLSVSRRWSRISRLVVGDGNATSPPSIKETIHCMTESIVRPAICG